MPKYSTLITDYRKTAQMNYAKIAGFLILTLSISFAICGPAHSQGSIFGTVANSDMTTPENDQIAFFGYLDDTDEEIRLESSTGAGYDAGNWFDDFQNYLTEAPGNPYDYHFFNIVNGEAAVLSKSIPNNSFQQENIQLGTIAYPAAPTGFTGAAMDDSTVHLDWNLTGGVSYHIYRRDASSQGSFFRIDNTGGSLADPGLTDNFYIDSTVDNISVYAYLLIPEESGALGVYSEIITVDSDPGLFVCGELNGDGNVNILDATFLLNYLYRGGPAPDPIESADVSGNGLLNILDVTYLLNYLYRLGPPLICP